MAVSVTLAIAGRRAHAVDILVIQVRTSTDVNQTAHFCPPSGAYKSQQNAWLGIVHLPDSEFTEVGVRFCKPGKSQHRSAKRDTEDSDTFAISQTTVNRQTNTYSRAQ